MTDAMPQQWAPVPGYEGLYEVSDHGNVRSLDRLTTGPSGKQRRRYGKPMKINLKPDHYPMVQLCKNGHVRGFSVHRLVAAAFLGVPDNADELHVCHYDGNRQNNHVSNLRWDTPKANYQDMVRHGTDTTNHPRRQPKPTCSRGHRLEGDNLYLYQEGKYLKRKCRECFRIRDRERYHRLKSQRQEKAA